MQNSASAGKPLRDLWEVKRPTSNKGNDNQRYHQSTVWLEEHRLISISSHFLRWFSAAPAVETGKNSHRAVSIPLGHGENSLFCHLPSLTSSTEHFYLAQLGHSHFAATPVSARLTPADRVCYSSSNFGHHGRGPCRPMCRPLRSGSVAFCRSSLAV
jgi:hypothetical protein